MSLVRFPLVPQKPDRNFRSGFFVFGLSKIFVEYFAQILLKNLVECQKIRPARWVVNVLNINYLYKYNNKRSTRLGGLTSFSFADVRRADGASIFAEIFDIRFVAVFERQDA